MMDRIQRMNWRQDQAVQEVIDNNGVGTAIMPTGSGKSFVFLKFIYKLLELGWIVKGDPVYFWAETNIRGNNMDKEIEKFKEIFGKNAHEDFSIKYLTYQSGHTSEFRAVDCYDEIDFALTAEYSRVISSSLTQFKLGLTATNQANSTVYRDKVEEELLNKVRQSDKATQAGKVTQFINKGQLLEVLCPVVYEYKLHEAIDEEVIAPFDTVVIEHELDRTDKSIKIWKSYDRRGSENDWYQAREKIRTDFRGARYRRAKMGKDQSKFLWELPSKADIANKLIPNLSGKTIVFSVNTALLYMVTDNVVTNATKSGFSLGHIYYSTKNTKKGKKYQKRSIKTTAHKYISESEYNKAWEKFKLNHTPDTELIERFNKGEIDVIASSKKISRGITLKGVQNAILLSYYSTTTDLLQKLGRILRHSEDKVANLFIIKTNGTREVEWFQKLPEVKNDKGQVDYRIPLNITKTIKSYQL